MSVIRLWLLLELISGLGLLLLLRGELRELWRMRVPSAPSAGAPDELGHRETYPTPRPPARDDQG
jgi:hypothetical protein